MTTVICDFCRTEVTQRVQFLGSKNVKIKYKTSSETALFSTWEDYDICGECKRNLRLLMSELKREPEKFDLENY